MDTEKFKLDKERERAFRALCDSFCRLYVDDVTAEWSIEWNIEGLEATVNLTDFSRREWSIKLVEHPDKAREIAISECMGDCYLEADDAGLFGSLWNQACQRLNEVTRVLEKYERATDKMDLVNRGMRPHKK